MIDKNTEELIRYLINNLSGDGSKFITKKDNNISIQWISNKTQHDLILVIKNDNLIIDYTKSIMDYFIDRSKLIKNYGSSDKITKTISMDNPLAQELLKSLTSINNGIINNFLNGWLNRLKKINNFSRNVLEFFIINSIIIK